MVFILEDGCGDVAHCTRLCCQLFGEDQIANIIMFKSEWTTSSNIVNYSTLYSEHSWEDLCIQLKNQQICNSNTYN